MANSTVFFCKECGYESPKWLGKCPGCNSWNSFIEEKIVKQKNNSNKTRENIFSNKAEIKKLKDITVSNEVRIDTGYEELNRVFGGGIVEGSLTLIGGEPGIGKSTLIIQICENLSKKGNVLYVSGEESDTQVKLRSQRLDINGENIFFLSETNISNIEDKIMSSKPKFCIIDSIQTMYDEEISSTPGSVSQVKEITARLMHLAKNEDITVIVIGHVTKDGVIAGPRILEHMVDVVLYIEGERFLSHRIVRGVKNRFGSTNEIGIFDMQDKGMVEVKNISDIFLDRTNENIPGNATIATIEGTSTILLEVQALTCHSYYNMPRRVANGVDFNRLNMILAVLEKKCNLSMGTQDVYVNIIGGIKVDEPAIDLGIAMAIISGYKNILLKKDTVYIGEIGLTGEIRTVNNLLKRIKEIEKMGYKNIVCSKKQVESISKELKNSSIKLFGYNTINEVIQNI